MSNETDPKPEGGNGSGGEGQASVEDLITQLEKEKAAAEAQAKDNHDRFLRMAADFENYKKRVKKELDESTQKGREALLKEILPVIDNLERALKHAPGDDPLAQGVRMVEKQLIQALEKFGITRFSAVGQPFDPAMHDAIQQVETSDVPQGTVAQEYASGYLSNGRLFRAAMVAVAKAPAAPEPQPSSDGPKG